MKSAKVDGLRVLPPLSAAGTCLPRSSAVARHRLLPVALLVVLAALQVAACGGEAPTGAATTSPISAAPSHASSEVSPPPALSRWSPAELHAALPGLLVARSEHPRLELVSPDGAKAVTLWRPPAGYGVGIADCDPRQGRILLRVWDRQAEHGYATLVLLSADGGARRLDLPDGDYSTGAALLTDGSILCNSANDAAFPATTLLWTDGSRDWRPVRAVGRLLKQPGIASLAPMSGRRAVAVMTWEGACVFPAAWRRGTLTVSGEPFHADPPFAAPLTTPGVVLLPRIDEREDRLSVDLIEVRWMDGRPRGRVVVDDGPQSSGHDALPRVGAGPDGSALVLGWPLEAESTPDDRPRLHHLRRLDLATGRLTDLALKVRSEDGWLWVER